MQPASQAGCLFLGFDYSVMVLVRSDSAPQPEIVPGFQRLVEPEILREIILLYVRCGAQAVG